MQHIIENKKILLLVTGSIAAYKALELASMLKKLGASLRVVMSEEAKKFVSPLSFEAILHTEVLHANSESWVGKDRPNHIAYAQWADIALVAPATANTLSKIAYGNADNLIQSTLLACKAPKLVAPAMNTTMLESPQILDSLKKLKTYGFVIIEPKTSLLACDTFGKGAMAEASEIVFQIAKTFASEPFWQDKEVIITGGGSIENIDSVRYISNHSSGLQASYLAIALYLLGARVKLISSSFPINLPLGITQINVKDTQSYLAAIKQNISQDKKTFLFMAAAISDYIPKNRFDKKLKKSEIGEFWNIECQKNIDILKVLNQPNLFKIGFKAETQQQSALEAAKKMLEPLSEGGKGCDMVCLNLIGKHNPFGSDQNQMTLLAKGRVVHTDLLSKLEIGFEIARFIKQC